MTKKKPVRRKKTMDVDPRWLEEIKVLATTERKPSEPPAAGAPARRMTMEVDPAWLEEARGEPSPAGSSETGAPVIRYVAPPPLPPVAATSRTAGPTKGLPPPIPREEEEEEEVKPAPRRSTKPPKR